MMNQLTVMLNNNNNGGNNNNSSSSSNANQQQQQYFTFQNNTGNNTTTTPSTTINQQTATGLATNASCIEQQQQQQQHCNQTQLVTIQPATATYSPASTNIMLTNGHQQLTTTQGFIPATNLNQPATIQYIITPSQQIQQQNPNHNQQITQQQQTSPFGNNGLMSNLITTTTPGHQINMIPINQTLQGSTTTLLHPQLIANGCTTTLQPTFIQQPSAANTFQIQNTAATNAGNSTTQLLQQQQQQFQVITTPHTAATLSNGAITFQTSQLIGIPSTNQIGQQQIILNPTITPAQPQQQQLYQLVLPTNGPQILQSTTLPPTNMITSSGQLITTGTASQQQQQPTAITVPIQQHQQHGTLLTTTGGNLTFPIGQQQHQTTFLTQQHQQQQQLHQNQMNSAIIHQQSPHQQQSSTNVFTTTNHLAIQPCSSSGNGNNNNNYLNSHHHNSNTITLIATASPTTNITNQSQSQTNITTSSINNGSHLPLSSMVNVSNNNTPINSNLIVNNINNNNSNSASTSTTAMMVFTSSTAASLSSTNTSEAGIGQQIQQQSPMVMFDDLIKPTSIKSINKKGFAECTTTTTTPSNECQSSSNNSTITTGQTGFLSKACATENFNLIMNPKATTSTTSTTTIITPKLSFTKAEQNKDTKKDVIINDDHTPSSEKHDQTNDDNLSRTVNDQKIINEKNDNEIADDGDGDGEDNVNDEDEKLNNLLSLSSSSSPPTPSIGTSLATSPSQTSSTIIQRPSSAASSCGSLKIADIDDEENVEGDEYVSNTNNKCLTEKENELKVGRKRTRSIDSLMNENVNDDDDSTDETEEMDLDSVETEIDSDCCSHKNNNNNNNDNSNNKQESNTKTTTSLNTVTNDNKTTPATTTNSLTLTNGIKLNSTIINNNNNNVKNINKSSSNDDKDGYQSSYGGSPCHFTDTEDEEDDDEDTNVNNSGQLSSMNGEIKLIRRNGLTQAAYNLINNRILMSSEDDNVTIASIESSITNDEISTINNSQNEKKLSNNNNDRISIQIQTSSSPCSIHSNGSSLIDTTTECLISTTPPTTSSSNPPLISSKERAIWTPEEQQLANEIQEFAKTFKLCRLSLGLTQSQVGQELSALGPCYSQSAICRFEKLDITLKSAKKIKPVLENWMREAEEKYRHNKIVGNVKPEVLMNGLINNFKDDNTSLSSSISKTSLSTTTTSTTTTTSSLSSSFKISSALELVSNSKNQQNNIKNPLIINRNNQSLGIINSTTINNESQMSSSPMISSNVNIYKAFMETNKKRKRRTSFTPNAIDALNKFFEQNNHPNGEEMTKISEILNYDRDVVRVWFCNKRQATKARSQQQSLPNSSLSDDEKSVTTNDPDIKSLNESTLNDTKSLLSPLKTTNLLQLGQQPTLLTPISSSTTTTIGHHPQFFRPIHPSHGQALRSPLPPPSTISIANESIPSVANIAPINLGKSTTTSTLTLSTTSTTNTTSTNNNSSIIYQQNELITKENNVDQKKSFFL